MVYVFLLALAVASSPSYEWRSFKDGTQDYALMLDGHQVGAYDAAKGIYRPYDREKDKWLPACPPPVEPPFRNYGVRMSSTEKGTHYRRAGIEISQEESDAVISGVSPLPSDQEAKRMHLVVIGPDGTTRPVLEAFESNSDLNAMKKDYLVQSFRPDDWQVSRSGYVCTGTPTIYLLDGTGKVLYRRDDFECGPDGLATALRDADPDYHPENDPGPALPLAFNDMATHGIGIGVCLFVLCSLVLSVWGINRWRSYRMQSAS